MYSVRPDAVLSGPLSDGRPTYRNSHTPVMPSEVADFFRGIAGDGLLVDGTAGAGGHMALLLEVCPDARLLGVERDPAAAAALADRFRDEERVIVRNASYTAIPAIISGLGLGGASGALFDLGLSTLQLDDPARGFSHSSDGPLDMRFDRSSGRTAADLVNGLSRRDLADIIYRYGEEGRSRRIADAIVEARPMRSTTELAAVVKGAVRGNPVRILSRVFQALRIAVNSELEHLEKMLESLPGWTLSGAGLACISFHSLEDRLIKTFFRDSPDFRPCSPPWATASAAEVSANSRARSARLRTGVRL
jgi:16S rRNA (cytosine1402-N4)-methyltransferase